MHLELGDSVGDDIRLIETINYYEDIQDAILSIENWSYIEISTKIA
jgi:hypothetical protein